MGKLITDKKTSIRNTAMNSAFKFKLIQALNKKNGNKGFTLIELLVVVIIIGVLAAIALLNLLGQVAKGRQAEARTNLGAINRAQQVQRMERGTFGRFSATVPADNDLPVSIQPVYYTYTGPTATSATGAVTDATAISTYQNDIRDYSAAVGQPAAGAGRAIICETTAPTTTFATATTTDGSAACGAGSAPIN